MPPRFRAQILGPVLICSRELAPFLIHFAGPSQLVLSLSYCHVLRICAIRLLFG